MTYTSPSLGSNMPSSQFLHRHVTDRFFQRTAQVWFEGFDRNFETWSADATLRSTTQTIVELFMRPDNPIAERYKAIPTEVLSIACLNVASRRSGDDIAGWLNRLVEYGAPDMNEIGRNPNRSDAKDGWYFLSVGFGAPNYPSMRGAWNRLATRFHAMVESVLPEDSLPMPTTFDDAEAFAWIARHVHDVSVADDTVVLETYGQTGDADAYDWADTLIEQHAIWKDTDVFTSGCGDLYGYMIPDLLAELTCYRAPLAPEHRASLEAIGVDWPIGLTLREGEDLICKLAELEDEDAAAPRYLATGFALVEDTEETVASSPVIAGSGEAVKLSMRNPIITLLDVDLTDERTAFLGLEGRRLRICDAASATPDTFFTRVDLDGGVKPISMLQKFPKPEAGCEHARPGYVLGRPLVTPFERLEACGGQLGTEHRFGGAPNWEQYPEDPMSPDSNEPMTFFAQVGHPLGGTAYVFLDIDNLVAAVVTQYD